jgi:type II secretory pathway pseudopilin PulG
MNRKSAKGITLLEIIVALFIFMVGIVGVLAALPTGINSALWVITQDAAIHLAHSKFAEFRRDRKNPAVDLVSGSAYLPSGGSYVAGAQEPINSSGAPWRDFASASGQPYEFFDDITKYEWRVDTGPVYASPTGTPAPTDYCLAPSTSSSGTPLNLTRVTIEVRMKGTTRSFKFSQYMAAYDGPAGP